MKAALRARRASYKLNAAKSDQSDRFFCVCRVSRPYVSYESYKLNTKQVDAFDHLQEI